MGSRGHGYAVYDHVRVRYAGSSDNRDDAAAERDADAVLQLWQPAGAFLLSATNPENGTVTYTYGSGGTLATKTDARNQQIRYTYDSYLRPTRISYYQTPTSQEDTQARVDIYYDTPYSGPSTNTLGRMTWKQYTAGQGAYTFRELYGYTQPGQLSSRTLKIESGAYSTSLAQSWAYDSEGRVTSAVYPAAGLNQDGTN